MKLLAGPIEDIFGKVSPPPGGEAFVDPAAGLGKLIGVSVNLFLIFAGLVMLIYMLWGGLDWILSTGEKEKLNKAQGKITNAAIGIFIIILALVLFNVIAGQVLHIIDTTGGWKFKLPTL